MARKTVDLTADVIEQAIREFPSETGWSNRTYGLDDLDFEDFAPALAKYITRALED